MNSKSAEAVKKEHVGEPLIRIAKRDNIPAWRAWGVRIIAVVLALLVNAVFIYSVTGLDPIAVYKVMKRLLSQSKRGII